MADARFWLLIAAGTIFWATTLNPVVAEEDKRDELVRRPKHRVSSAATSAKSDRSGLTKESTVQLTILDVPTPAGSAEYPPGGFSSPDAVAASVEVTDRLTSSGDCNPHSCRRLSLCSRSPWHRRIKRQMQRTHWGYPEEFHEPPFGSFLQAHLSTQLANGQAARMVLYHYDFVRGRGGLNAKGIDQLKKIAPLLLEKPFPVVIERTVDNPRLDEARRLAVLSQLRKLSAPVPEEQVVVGPPISNGLRNVESELVYQNLLNQTEAAGVLIPGGGVGTGQGSQQSSGASGGLRGVGR